MKITLDTKTTGLTPVPDAPAYNYGVIVTQFDVDMLRPDGFLIGIQTRYKHQWGEPVVLVDGQYLLVCTGSQWTLVYEGKDGRATRIDPRAALELLGLELEDPAMKSVRAKASSDPVYALAALIRWRSMRGVS